jgi:hypothetical protein
MPREAGWLGVVQRQRAAVTARAVPVAQCSEGDPGFLRIQPWSGIGIPDHRADAAGSKRFASANQSRSRSKEATSRWVFRGGGRQPGVHHSQDGGDGERRGVELGKIFVGANAAERCQFDLRRFRGPEGGVVGSDLSPTAGVGWRVWPGSSL